MRTVDSEVCTNRRSGARPVIGRPRVITVEDRPAADGGVVGRSLTMIVGTNSGAPAALDHGDVGLRQRIQRAGWLE